MSDLSQLSRTELESLVSALLEDAPTPVSGQAGENASVTVVAATTTVEGLSGMTTQSVGRLLALGGAASTPNNGVFPIVAFNSPVSVEIAATTTVAPDANNGSIYWAETTSTDASVLIQPVIESLASARADLLQCGLDRDTLQAQVDLYQTVIVPGGAGDPTGPSFASVTDLGRQVMDASWSGLAFEYYEFAIGTAGYDAVDPKIATPVDPTAIDLISEVGRYAVTAVEEAGGSTVVVRCRIPDAIQLGIGELGIFGRVTAEPDPGVIPAMVPQNVGDEFLVALAHFPLTCYGTGRRSLERIAITD